MMHRMEQLAELLRPYTGGGITLAFSGGTDSSFLLFALKKLREEQPFALKAVMMQTIFQPQDEPAEAKEIAAELGLDLEILHCDPLSLPELRTNPPDRCYWCKRHIFGEILKYSGAHGIRTLMDGTQADDRHSYRPGRKALRELGVVSPLAELGFTKAEIRSLAGEYGLRFAAKPAMPCLATRFEYGTELTPELLGRTARGESMIRHLLPENTAVRLRVQRGIARIEVPPEAMATVLENRKRIVAELRKLKFEFITLDLEGFRSGCYDKNQEDFS